MVIKMNDKRNIKELSKKEKDSLELFNKTKDKLIKKGYTEHDLTINVVKANIYGILLPIPIAIILVILYCLFNRFEFEEITMIVFLIINMFIATIIHESIHGITFSLFTKNHLKDIRFGFIVKTLTPYCSCKVPVKKYQYLLGISMPGLTLGVLICIISIILGKQIILYSGLFQLFCAGGDMMIIALILKNKSNKKNQLYLDHPTEVGVVLFDK